MIRSVLLPALLLLPLARDAVAAEVVRYAILMEDGTRAGHQIVRSGEDGATEVEFLFKDNGRGPELRERFLDAADGTLAAYTVVGKGAIGNSIDERYLRGADGRAEWRNGAERGSAAPPAGAEYVPVNGSYHAASRAIRRFAARGDGALPLMPGGTLTQTTLLEVDLRGVDGGARRVRLVAQSGLGFKPVLYWATTGEAPRLFAVFELGYRRLIEEGWESAADLLAGRQAEAEASLLRRSAERLLRPLPGLTRIRDVRVFDSARAELGALSDVYLLRGRITAVVPAGTAVQAASQTIAGGGRVLLPGLFDMHTHVAPWDGALHLAAGVTTVRDMANGSDLLQRLIGEQEAGHWPGPKIVPVGVIEGTSPHASYFGWVVADLDEAKRAVDWYAAHGYRQVKLYNSFHREDVPAIVAYAHARGLRISGHVPAFLRARDVVAAGFDEIQHINQVLLNFLATPETDTRTLQRFLLPAERAGALDLESADVREFIRTLRDRRVVIDPTLAVFGYIQQRDGEVAPVFAPVIDRLPPDVRRTLRTASMEIPDEATAERYRRSYARMIEMVGAMHRAGVQIVAGTDEMPGFALQGELELYVRAGLSPAEALRIATYDAARIAGEGHARGRIAPGMVADLVLIDGDPTRDIVDLRKASLVIAEGRWLSPAEAYRSLSVAPSGAAELRPEPDPAQPQPQEQP